MVNKKILYIVLAIIVFLIFAGITWWYYPFKIGTATLSWNANTETNLAGYKIYYGTTPRNDKCPPGGYPEKIDVGNVTSYVLNGLASGQTYYFSITSYNTADKESCFSEEGKKIISRLSKIIWLKNFLAVK